MTGFRIPDKTTNVLHTHSHMVLVNMADTAPAQAAKVVFTAANAATSPRAALLMVAAEPGLKPYQPNQRQNVPRNYG
jgi:hypothetical protein